MKQKKILIVGPPSLGYLNKINEILNKNTSVKSDIVLVDRFSFKYKNKAHKIKNFLSKIFLNKNLKKEHVKLTIENKISKIDHQDIIFVIRPDLLHSETLQLLKKNCVVFKAFYYDSTRRFPKKAEIIDFFDTVYSYDRLDVEKYDLEFLTNYIYDESCSKEYKTLFFNISTYDYRYESMLKLAEYIHNKNWSKEILILGPNELKSEYLTIINNQISVDQVANKIKNCKIIIEIQREEQVGLSFRVFEALGHRKKLITTNKDVVNYDFYNPNNILVIDIDNINIPEEFINTDYQEIDNEILDKYRLENWVKNVFDL